MERLNFPQFNFRFKNKENKLYIFDEVRKVFVFLTPEEWVRQHTLHYLIYIKGFKKWHISVEKSLKINQMTKRYDIVVHKPNGDVWLLVECKKPSITISQQTFDQIAQYNMLLKAEFLMVTNGINHYFCKVDWQMNRFHFLKDIPN